MPMLSLDLLLLQLVLNLFLSFALFHLLSSGGDALGGLVAVYDKSRHEPRKEFGVGRVPGEGRNASCTRMRIRKHAFYSLFVRSGYGINVSCNR